MKKFLALLMAAVMVLSICSAALAESAVVGRSAFGANPSSALLGLLIKVLLSALLGLLTVPMSCSTLCVRVGFVRAWGTA